MLPKLAWNAGIAAVAAGVTLLVVASMTPSIRSALNRYPLTVSTNASGHFVIPNKPSGNPPLFKLDYYGAVTFTVTNGTDNPINFRMQDFRPGPGGGCPVEFLMNGDNSQCMGRLNLQGRESGTIFAIRGDSNSKKSDKYKFFIRVNGQDVDPEIEIERDPGGRNLLKYWLWLIVGGGISLFVGWWLRRVR